MIIYKITNLINHKIYIGLTTTSLSRRWSAHIRDMKNNDERHLYSSMRKYGIENFKIESIDETAKNLVELGKLERQYISQFNSRNPNIGYNLTAGGERNQWDSNPRATLTMEEVIQIREIYANCELSCKQCWEMFKDKISYSAFKKVWNGYTWEDLHSEVYTKENKFWHKHNSPLSRGELNHNSLYSNTEVLEIRKFYVTHTLQETYSKYGYKTKNKDSFRQIVDGNSGYTNIPVYKKSKQKWFLNNQEIDINNYNPVSTISESGE